MNTISDSLIEKLEELYPKPKPEPVKEEPVAVKQSVTDYTITSGGSTYSGSCYPIQSPIVSTNSGITLPPNWGNLILPLLILDQTKVKEDSGSYETTLKNYINDKIINLEYKLKDHIRQEIDKLKCSPGTHT